MGVTGSFLTEGGWLYLASAMVASVLTLLRLLGVVRAGRAAAALLALTLAGGGWFTASYAKLIDEVAWHRRDEPAERILYERCISAGRSYCRSEHPRVDYFLQHRLLGVYVPLAGAAALGIVMVLKRRAHDDA